VVDSEGNFSQQIDVVVFDRQYSPFIFSYEGQTIIPAESVYAVFEAKQTLNADLVRYAQDKVASVRKLHRTSLPIPHAGGTYPAKPLFPIIGGILAFESDWNPPMGQSLDAALRAGSDENRLDLGCVAAHGTFSFNQQSNGYSYDQGGKPATAFLFNLISRAARDDRCAEKAVMLPSACALATLRTVHVRFSFTSDDGRPEGSTTNQLLRRGMNPYANASIHGASLKSLRTFP
jgi:hypothetical protein